MADTHIECVVQVKVKMTVEMASNKVVNFRLRLDVKVLELVQGRELLDVQAVRCHEVWSRVHHHVLAGVTVRTRLAFQELFRFQRGDVRDSGEDIGSMCGRALDAVPAKTAAIFV